MDAGVEAALAAVRIEIQGDGCVVLLHAAELDAARLIFDTGVMSSRDPRHPNAYAATAPEILGDHGGEVLVPVRVKVDDLHIRRRWPVCGECEVRRFEVFMDGPNYKPVAVGRRAYDDSSSTERGPDWLRE